MWGYRELCSVILWEGFAVNCCWINVRFRFPFSYIIKILRLDINNLIYSYDLPKNIVKHTVKFKFEIYYDEDGRKIRVYCKKKDYYKLKLMM